jgi:hypothetical protein
VDGTLFKFDDQEEVWHCHEPKTIPVHWMFWREPLTDKGTCGGTGSHWFLDRHTITEGPFTSFIRAVQWAKQYAEDHSEVFDEVETDGGSRFVHLKLTPAEARVLRTMLDTAMQKEHQDPGYLTPTQVKDCNQIRGKMLEELAKFNRITA